jgi:hypothetical protein
MQEIENIKQRQHILIIIYLYIFKLYCSLLIYKLFLKIITDYYKVIKTKSIETNLTWISDT